MQSSKFQFKIKKFQNGFTLIELLAVMVILMTVGVVIGTILLSALRGSNKTNAVTNAKQNGTHAITQMSKLIREAKRFGGVSVTESGTYETNCTNLGDQEYNYLKLTSLDDGQTTLACLDGVGEDVTISSTSAQTPDEPRYLLDSSRVALKQGGCYFKCTQASSVDFPTIEIHFELTEAPNLGSFVENKISGASGITFETTVTMRNSNR